MLALPPVLIPAAREYDRENEQKFRDALTRYFQQQRTDETVLDPTTTATAKPGTLVKSVAGGSLANTLVTESAGLLTVGEALSVVGATTLGDRLSVGGVTTLGADLEWSADGLHNLGARDNLRPGTGFFADHLWVGEAPTVTSAAALTGLDTMGGAGNLSAHAPDSGWGAWQYAGAASAWVVAGGQANCDTSQSAPYIRNATAAGDDDFTYYADFAHGNVLPSSQAAGLMVWQPTSGTTYQLGEGLRFGFNAWGQMLAELKDSSGTVVDTVNYGAAPAAWNGASPGAIRLGVDVSGFTATLWWEPSGGGAKTTVAAYTLPLAYQATFKDGNHKGAGWCGFSNISSGLIYVDNVTIAPTGSGAMQADGWDAYLNAPVAGTYTDGGGLYISDHGQSGITNGWGLRIASQSHSFGAFKTGLGAVDLGDAVTARSTLDVKGAATLESTLGVTGAATLSSTLHTVGAVTFDSTLGVTGAATLSSTLHGVGAVTFDSTLSAKSTTVAGALSVTGTGANGIGTFDQYLVTRGDTGSSGIVHHWMTQASGTIRFGMGLVGTASGSDAGADFSLWGYSDTGTLLGQWLKIVRKTGAATFLSTVSATQYTSTVATGTAPFVVASTTLVANLHAANSDALGGTAAASYALLASPTFTGVPAAPTAAPGTNTTQLATTAFVHAATSALVTGVSSVFGRTGAVVAVAGDYGPTLGGTGQTSWTLGDLLYASAANTLAKLGGNTTATKMYLSQTGTGAVSAAPAWAQVAFADLSGIIASAQVSGAYPNITGVGTLASGAVPASLVTAGTFSGAYTVSSTLTVGGTLQPAVDAASPFGSAALRWTNGFFSGSLYLGTNPAASGSGLHMANAFGVSARNAANTGDITLIGTDASDNINIGLGLPSAINFSVQGRATWQVSGAGHFLNQTDNTFDIGALNATRPRSLYVGTSGVFGTDPGGTASLRVGTNANGSFYFKSFGAIAAAPSGSYILPIYGYGGGSGSSLHPGTGTNLNGVVVNYTTPSTATASSAGLTVTMQTQAAAFNAGTVVGLYVTAPVLGAGSSVSAVYGQRVDNQGNAAFTTSYGLFVNSQSGSTNTYGVYSALGLNYFGSPVSIVGNPGMDYNYLLRVGWSGATHPGTGVNIFGIGTDYTAPATATGVVAGYYARTRTAAAAITTAVTAGLYVDTAILGAGSTVTTSYGLFINGQTAAAGTSYGIYLGNITGGATNYALRTNAGQVLFGDTFTVGAIATAAALVNVSGLASKIAGTSIYGGFFDITGASTHTAATRALQLRAGTAAAAYTTAEATGLHILDATLGAGSTITTQYGILIDDQTKGASKYAIKTGLGLVYVGDQLQSAVTTGTAPFIVASTTAVTNLNADLLDGQHGSYYAPLASPTFTGTPAAPTPSWGDNSTNVATTAFVASSEWTYVFLGTDFVTLSATPVDTGLSFTPSSSANYEIEVMVFVDNTSTSNGCTVGYTIPDQYTFYAGRHLWRGNDFLKCNVTPGKGTHAGAGAASVPSALSGGVAGGSNGTTDVFDCRVLLYMSSGTVTVPFKVTIASGTGTANVIVSGKSFLRYRRVG